ncbi:hypothetical protein QBC39DRAFT_263136 [Podospora conica]|nr:hypothetical protein QBC39DRAFT_263136 [Schizothecium conicum]
MKFRYPIRKHIFHWPSRRPRRPRLFPRARKSGQRNAVTLAAELLALLIRADKPGKALIQRLHDTATTQGRSWSEWLAERVLHGLEETLKGSHEKWGDALADAYARAVAAVEEKFAELWEYAKEHPKEVAAGVVLTLVAIAVLALLTPWVLELLGFAAEGPLAGSFAAWWQAMYRGLVPRGSLFSLLQRLGMVWGKGGVVM